MRDEDQAKALQLIDETALAIQARRHPGRPMFYAMDRVRHEIRRARAHALQAPAAPPDLPDPA